MSDLTDLGPPRTTALRLNNRQLEITVDAGLTWTAVGTGGGAVGTLLASDPALVEMTNLNALGLGLTQFKRIPIGFVLPTVTEPVASDGAIEGGAIANISTGNFTVLGQSVFQHPRTGKWAISFRANMPVPNGANTIDVGILNGAGTHALVCRSGNGSTDVTNFVIQFLGAGNTFSTNQTRASDAAWHWIRLTGDGTTVRLYIDNALAATLVLDGNVVDEPMYPAIFSTTGLKVIQVADIVYGYVAP